MDPALLTEAAALLQRDYNIEIPGIISEEHILSALRSRLSVLLDKNPESFFQLMYRLDIAEGRLNEALQQDDAAGTIARLVYERQLQKIASRKLFRSDHEDETLKW